MTTLVARGAGFEPAVERRLFWSWTAFLVAVVFVILFGAVVRITGSGAGCGQHWPTCHGELAHLPKSVETWIEWTHRLTSGLSFVVVVVLAWCTFRRLPGGHPARKAAAFSILFMITESLVGAALVLLALVGENSSILRALIMAVHLLNTSFLTASILGACFFLRAGSIWGGWRSTGRSFLVGALVLLGISASGAVTALGDTLYPVSEGPFRLETAVEVEGAHFLERLRGFHPLLALGGAVYLLFAIDATAPVRTRVAVQGLVTLQVGAGLANVWLSAPGWMQVVHLSLATGLWLIWIWYGLERSAGTTTRGPLGSNQIS